MTITIIIRRSLPRVAVNPGHDNISCRGMYATTKIYGIEGHSYQLDIFYGGKHYKSDIQRMESHCLYLIEIEAF